MSTRGERELVPKYVAWGVVWPVYISSAAF